MGFVVTYGNKSMEVGSLRGLQAEVFGKIINHQGINNRVGRERQRGARGITMVWLNHLRLAVQ
jgi:hypothetical protein